MREGRRSATRTATAPDSLPRPSHDRSETTPSQATAPPSPRRVAAGRRPVFSERRPQAVSRGTRRGRTPDRATLAARTSTIVRPRTPSDREPDPAHRATRTAARATRTRADSSLRDPVGDVLVDGRERILVVGDGEEREARRERRASTTTSHSRRRRERRQGEHRGSTSQARPSAAPPDDVDDAVGAAGDPGPRPSRPKPMTAAKPRQSADRPVER